eukprot:5788789-Amphidinium_carterae.3
MQQSYSTTSDFAMQCVTVTARIAARKLLPICAASKAYDKLTACARNHNSGNGLSTLSTSFYRLPLDSDPNWT